MAKTLTTQTISNELAETLMRGAVAKAEAMGVPMCIAICDPSGALVQFLRMDRAALLSVNIAQDKAYTAVSFGMATHEWHDFIKDDAPLLHGIVHGVRPGGLQGFHQQFQGCAVNSKLHVFGPCGIAAQCVK